MSAESRQIKGDFGNFFLNKVLKSFTNSPLLNYCPNVTNDMHIVTILNYLTAEHVGVATLPI